MVTKTRISPSFSDEGMNSVYDYICLSSDDKPTDDVAVNSLLLEVDTFSFYYFDGEAWQPLGGQE